jgi:hypothetical protein
MAKFQTQTGYGVTVYPPGGAPPIRIHAEAPYETDDKEMIKLLRGQPGLAEVKEQKAPTKQTKRAKPEKK